MIRSGVQLTIFDVLDQDQAGDLCRRSSTEAEGDPADGGYLLCSCGRLVRIRTDNRLPRHYVPATPAQGERGQRRNLGN